MLATIYLYSDYAKTNFERGRDFNGFGISGVSYIVPFYNARVLTASL
jgi:hypothetical protein